MCALAVRGTALSETDLVGVGVQHMLEPRHVATVADASLMT